MAQAQSASLSEGLSEAESARADRDVAAMLFHAAALLREEAGRDRNLAALYRHEIALANDGRTESDDWSLSPADGWHDVVGLLQATANALDQLWNETRSNAGANLGMALAEASHGVHRALNALREGSRSNFLR